MASINEVRPRSIREAKWHLKCQLLPFKAGMILHARGLLTMPSDRQLEGDVAQQLVGRGQDCCLASLRLRDPAVWCRRTVQKGKRKGHGLLFVFI